MPSGWQRRKRDRPGEIVAAVAALLCIAPAETLRMADIAARAGITKGTIYLYFANKDDLLRRAMAEYLSRGSAGQDFVDAPSVHVDHLKVPIVGMERLAGVGKASETIEHETRHRVKGATIAG